MHVRPAALPAPAPRDPGNFISWINKILREKSVYPLGHQQMLALQILRDRVRELEGDSDEKRVRHGIELTAQVIRGKRNKFSLGLKIDGVPGIPPELAASLRLRVADQGDRRAAVQTAGMSS